MYLLGADAVTSLANGEALRSQTGTALAVLRGSAVNTNGRSSTLTAPHGPTQQVLLRQALGVARAGTWEVGGLQLHSNGTTLGEFRV